MANLRPAIERFLLEIFSNDSVIRRFEGTGVVDAQTARLFGAVGPATRASNGDVDVRALAPYGAYDTLQIENVVAKNGDVLARCDVKRRETIDSVRFIGEALELLMEISCAAVVTAASTR